MVDPAVEIVEVELDGIPTLLTAQEYDDERKRGSQPRFLRTVVARDTLLNLSGSEALALGMADGTPSSLGKLCLLLGLQENEVQVVERRASEDAANFLYNWTPLFLILGFLLAYVELKVPGFGIAGIASIACFAVVLVGRYLVGMADVPHIIVIVLGIALVAGELFLVPGTIWIGLLGIVCVVGGLIWSFVGSATGFTQGLDQEILLNESMKVFGSACIAMVATWSLSRFLPHTPVVGRMVLDPKGSEIEQVFAGGMPQSRGLHAELARVGARGRTLTALRPAGKVVLAEDESIDFEARSSGPEIAPGTRIVVVETSGTGRLVVEPLS